MIKRELQDKIQKKMFSGKTIFLFGPRQVGKTTLLKKLHPLTWTSQNQTGIIANSKMQNL